MTLIPPGATRTFAGFRSRWITPAPWMAVSAVATPTAMLCTLRRAPAAPVPGSPGPGSGPRRTPPPGTAGRGPGRRPGPRRCRTAEPGGPGSPRYGIDHGTPRRARVPSGRPLPPPAAPRRPGQEDAAHAPVAEPAEHVVRTEAGRVPGDATRCSRRMPADHDHRANRSACHPFPLGHSDAARQPIVRAHNPVDAVHECGVTLRCRRRGRPDDGGERRDDYSRSCFSVPRLSRIPPRKSLSASGPRSAAGPVSPAALIVPSRMSLVVSPEGRTR